MYMIAVAEVLVIQAAFYHLIKVLKLVPGPSLPIRQHRGLRTEIITFPLKGRLSSFIVPEKIFLPSKILH